MPENISKSMRDIRFYLLAYYILERRILTNLDEHLMTDPNANCLKSLMSSEMPPNKFMHVLWQMNLQPRTWENHSILIESD